MSIRNLALIGILGAAPGACDVGDDFSEPRTGYDDDDVEITCTRIDGKTYVKHESSMHTVGGQQEGYELDRTFATSAGKTYVATQDSSSLYKGYRTESRHRTTVNEVHTASGYYVTYFHDEVDLEQSYDIVFYDPDGEETWSAHHAFDGREVRDSTVGAGPPQGSGSVTVSEESRYDDHGKLEFERELSLSNRWVADGTADDPFDFFWSVEDPPPPAPQQYEGILKLELTETGFAGKGKWGYDPDDFSGFEKIFLDPDTPEAEATFLHELCNEGNCEGVIGYRIAQAVQDLDSALVEDESRCDVWD